MKPLNVLSLFNGGGMLRPALDRAGIKVNQYYSSEIDKYANQVASKNYPDTIQLGDVTEWKSWDLPKIDLLVAGFPCQDLSCAGKQAGLNGERSGLLYTVLEIAESLKPQYFLYENVASMSGRWRDEISKLVGANPVLLNSKYWGAQNRSRYFWTNIPNAKNIEINQAKNDKKIYLRDILEDDAFGEEKARCLAARYCGVAETENQLRRFIDGKPGTFVFYDDFVRVKEATKKGYCDVRSGDCVDLAVPTSKTRRGRLMRDKANALTTQNEFYQLTSLGFRKLTPVECERLMNLPDGYTEGVSNSQRYKICGNGFDVHVVADLLRGIVELEAEIQPELFAGVA